MKTLFGVSAFFLVFTAFTVTDSGIEGTWIGKVSGPNGKVEITYNFNVNGDTLTGTVVGGMGEVEILNGEVTGKEFYFETQFNNITITHDCELTDENKIVMEFQFGQGGPGPQELILTRESEED